ncbi:acetylxylan esterase [Halorarum halophilum]|uniref:Acetylxylan esterase n=1 Tax=Halorarum halophilum TaxID=2743090 RepID=A0A7D5KVF2_9EURY|nr:alpha/beta fold hydrolase [Halobaculum halophilum]QLG28840.1 acetylxylan esterase [Halobaculum halophilum]
MEDRRFGHDRAEWTEHVLRASDLPFAYGGETGSAFPVWQETLREELRSVLGFPVIREGGVPDLDPRCHGTEAAADHERQMWSVRTEREFRVPFYLLLPNEPEPPYPVVLTVHGHAESGKELSVGEVESDADRERIADERRDIARQAVECGYAAVAPDMRAFGELAAPETASGDRQCTSLQKHAQLVGRTLVGERVWDTLRLIEFVQRRAALDVDRLAITGHSGGGVVTLFAAALDDRLSPVAPCASVCPFEDSLVPIDHCVCNYVPGIRRLGEVWDFAGLIAPRPLLVAAGEHDPIFPIEGTRRAFDRLRDVYRGSGAHDACELYVGDGGHRYYEAGVWPFIRDHL